MDSPARREMSFISFVYIPASLPDCFLWLSFAFGSWHPKRCNMPPSIHSPVAINMRFKPVAKQSHLHEQGCFLIESRPLSREALQIKVCSYLYKKNDFLFFAFINSVVSFQILGSSAVWGLCLLVAHAPKCSCACTTAKSGLWREQNSLVRLADFLTHCFCSSCSSHTSQTPRTESWSSFGLKEILTFSVSMWTTSLASGFSSHRGAPAGSFKNATIDWERKEGDEKEKEGDH